MVAGHSATITPELPLNYPKPTSLEGNPMLNNSDTQIASLVSRMAEINGGQYINPRAPYSHALRAAGQVLLEALGATPAQADMIDDAIITQMYGVAMRNPASARNTLRAHIKRTWPDAPDAIATSAATVDAEAIARIARAAATSLVQHATDEIRIDATASAKRACRALTDDAIKAIPALVTAAFAAIAPKPVQITVADSHPITFGISHPMLAEVIRLCAMGEDVWLKGPRGSGKSMGARQVAEAFGVRCYIMTGADDLTAIVGYIQPHDGSIKSTPFRDAWINGGVILLDEGDTYNPAAIIVLNDALANGRCTFADGSYPKHPQCYVIMATNTDGRGPDDEYNARSQMDASTRDRFAYVPWDYVPSMETQLGAQNAAWTRYVQAVRAMMVAAEMPEVPSPRASIKGAKYIANGGTWEDACERYIWKGYAPEQVQRVNRAVDIEQYKRDCAMAVSIL
jgi:hypothetical protein